MAAIKESSDELNPAVAISPDEVPPRKRRSASDYLALAVATCGVGYFPIAPGTLGSLVGVVLYVAIFVFGHHVLFANIEHNEVNQRMVWLVEPTLVLVAIFLLTMVGIWAGTRVEKLIRRKDPSIVVIDEVAGQMVALLSGPLWLHTLWRVFSAFVLFRLFDIWKPYPIRRLEKLESGLGVMADDVVAGLYAAVVNSVLVAAFAIFFS